MCVVAARRAVLWVITRGGKWDEITANTDPLYQHLIVTAERKFWRCVETGELPRLFGIEPPKPQIEAIRWGHLRPLENPKFLKHLMESDNKWNPVPDHLVVVNLLFQISLRP